MQLNVPDILFILFLSMDFVQSPFCFSSQGTSLKALSHRQWIWKLKMTLHLVASIHAPVGSHSFFLSSAVFPQPLRELVWTQLNGNWRHVCSHSKHCHLYSTWLWTSPPGCLDSFLCKVSQKTYYIK